ncbi:MAG: hypothetical protein IAF94_18335 [Pirellulaceae bacterium]|nr:hypothetical protein [Pirellulaceae bacterium]
MSGANGGATVSLSIDLELAIGRQTSQGQQRLELVTASLVELLDNQGISATWGVSNPALSAARDMILAAKSKQEVAVLGERFWLGDGATPSRLAQEFQRRFEGARRAGLVVSTLLLRQAAEHLDLNLLLGHGISAVRGPAVAASADAALTRGGAMRYGLWQVESPILIPLSGSWWQAEPWAFRQRLREATLREVPLNLVLDAGKMAELNNLGLPAMAEVIRKLGQMQDNEQLRFETLGDLARHHLSRRASQPSRSVLAA